MKIKGLNVIKSKFVPLALAGTMALSLTGCGGRVDMSSVSFEDLLAIEEVKDITLMDEMVEDGLFDYSEDKSYVEVADDTLRYLDIVEELKDIDFSEIPYLSKLSDEEYLSTLDFSLDEVKALEEQLSSKDKSYLGQENRLNAYKKLDYLNNYCNEFLHENGYKISLNMMMKAVKASIAAELGLKPEEVSNVIIPPNRLTVNDEPYFSVEVDDKNYTVKLSFDEMTNTISYIYALQDANLTEETEYETYRKALNFAKTTIAAGSNLKNDKFVEQNSDSYIEKNIVKK